MEITIENYQKQIELLEIQNEIDYWEDKKKCFEKKYQDYVLNEMPFWLRDLIVERGSYNQYQKKIRSLQIQRAMKENGKQIGFNPLEIEKARERHISEFYGNGKTRPACPFHNAKPPSMEFAIYDNKYKCFSCGIFGDVIDFVMRYNHLTFLEAIKYLL